MAYLIDPRCGLPIYALDSHNTAVNCGKISGYILSIILSIIIIIGAAYIYFGDLFDKKNNKKKYLFYTITILILIFIWCTIPPLTGWENGKSFLVYQEQLKSYTNIGMTKEEAFKKIQELYQTKLMSGSISTAGLNVAASILASKR